MQKIFLSIPVRRIELNGIKIFNSQEYLSYPRASYIPQTTIEESQMQSISMPIFFAFVKYKPNLKINKKLNCLFLLEVL